MVLKGSPAELPFNLWSTLTWNHFLCVRKQCPLSNHPSHFSLLLTPAPSWRHEAPQLECKRSRSHLTPPWLARLLQPAVLLVDSPEVLVPVRQLRKRRDCEVWCFYYKRKKSYHWFIYFCCCLRQQSHCVTMLSSNWDPPASASLMLDDKHAPLYLAH